MFFLFVTEIIAEVLEALAELLPAIAYAAPATPNRAHPLTDEKPIEVYGNELFR